MKDENGNGKFNAPVSIFGNNDQSEETPVIDDPDQFENIGQAYTATWTTPRYTTSTRAITAFITLSENPGSSYSVTDDFRVEVRSGSSGSYRWSTASGWTLAGSSTGTTRSVIATPANTVDAGTYRLVLKEDAFGTDKPSADIATVGQEILAFGAFVATWATPTYSTRTRAISAFLTLSEDPGSSFSVTNDFKVQVQSGANWNDSSGWTLSSPFIGTHRLIIATPAESVTAGTYRLVLKEDAFGTDKPSADIATTGQAVAAYVHLSGWAAPTYTSTTRAINARITVSEPPGSSFSVTNDFKVQVQSGANWNDSSGWTLSAAGWTFARQPVDGFGNIITATPDDTVAAGIYRLVLKEDAFGTDKPSADTVTTGQAIAAYVAPLTYTAIWGVSFRTDDTRVIGVVLSLSEDPGATFSVTNDFMVEVRSGSTWSAASGWILSSTGTGTVRSIIATATIMVSTGTYRLVLKKDAFGTNKPNANINSNPESYVMAYFITWAAPTYTISTRAINAVLTLSEDPGLSFSVTNDFKVQIESGANWNDSSGWTFLSTGTGTTRTITATPSNTVAAGTYRLVVKEDAFGTNKPSLDTVTHGQLVGAYITPVVATATWSAVSYCITSGKLQGTLTFNNPISDIEISDFEVLTDSDGATTGWVFDTPPSTAIANTGILIQVTPPANTNASFKIRLKATSVRSGTTAMDNSPASATTTASTPVDNRPAIVATAAWSAVSYTNRKLQGTLTFNQNVTGITVDDFEILNDNDVAQITGWTFDTIPTVASANTGITIAATPPRNLNASFKIRLKEVSVLGPRAAMANSPSANIDTAAIPVDSNPIIATAAWSNMVGTNTLSGRITFSGAAVRGITNADFEVLDNSDAVQSTGWTIAVSGATATTGGFVTVTATPSGITDASYKLRLKATSVISDFATTNNAPAAAVTSSAVRVNTVTWTNMSFTGGKLQGDITFTRGGTHVSGLFPRHFQVLDTDGNAVTGWTFDSVPNLQQINRPLTIRATPPTPTSRVLSTYTFGRFGFRMMAQSVTDRPSNTRVPLSNTDSEKVAIDNRPTFSVATASWSNINGGTGNSATLSGRVTFSGAAVTGIANTDFEVTDTDDMVQTGWTIAVSGTTATDGGFVTVTATPPASTNASFKLRIKALSVAGGNSFYDNSPAMATISTAQPVDNTPAVATAFWSNIDGGETLSGRINFSGAAVTNVDTSDFEVIDNASTPAVQTGWTIAISGTTAAAGGHIIVTATPPANTNASFRLRLKATSVRSDSSTMDNAPENSVISISDTVDNRAIVATAAWSMVAGGTARTATLSGRITFSGANVTNIETTDFEVLNASNVAQTIGSGGWTIAISGSSALNGSYITVTATPPANQNADFKLQLKATSVRSDSSNVDNAPANVVRSIGRRVNNVPIKATGSWSNLTGGATLVGTMTFSGAAVTNIENADFEVINASNNVQGTWTIAVSSSTATNGGSVTVTATPPARTTGSFRLRLRATSVRSDSSPMDNAPENAVTSAAQQIDNVPIVATASWANVNYCSTSNKIQGELTFARANVTNIATTDFEIIDAAGTVHTWTFDTPSSTATAGTAITIRATVPSNTLGDFRIRLKRNSVRSGGSSIDNAPDPAATSPAVSNIDTRVIATPVWTSITGGETLVGTMRFNNAGVFGIAAADFEVLNDSDAPQTTGWTIVPSATSATAGSSITVTATGPANTNASFKLRLKATSIQSGRAGSNNAPSAAVTSTAQAVDNRPIVATANWSNINYCSTSNKIQGDLTFSGANVIDIANTDFEIINASNTVQSWIFDAPSATAAAGTAITIRATVPSNTNGAFRFRLKATSVKSDSSTSDNAPATAVTSTSVDIDTRVKATGAWSNIVGGSTLSGRMTFTGAPVSGIESDDFQVLNDSDQVQSNWTIIVSSSMVPAGGFTTVTAAPNIEVHSDFKLRLRANRVQSGASGTDNAPESAVTSTSIAVDSRTFTVATAAWTNMTGDETLSGRLTFTGSSVSGITGDDFEVLNASDVVQSTGWTITTSGSAVSNRGYVTITATPSDLIDAEFKLRLKATSVRSDSSPSNNAPAAAIVSPTVRVNTITWRTISYERNNRQLEGTIRFTGGSGTVSGITTNSFDVLDESGTRQTGWTINTPPTSANVGGDAIAVSARSTTAMPGLFKMRMKQRSAQFTRTSQSQSGPSGQQSVQVPANNVDSDTTEIPFGTATVTIPQNSQGAIQISLQKRSFWVDGSPEQIGPPFNQYLGTVFYDTRVAVPEPDTFSGAWDYANWCEGDGKILASIRFNEAITGLNVMTDSNLNSDLEVHNETKNANFTNWTFSFSGHTGTDLANASLAANTPLVIEATPPPNTNANVYLAFASSSITYGSTNQAGPSSIIYTEVIPVDNRPDMPIDIPSISIDGGSFCETSRIATWTVYVNGATETQLGNLTGTDITVNRSDTSITIGHTVTRSPATGSSFQVVTDAIPTGNMGNISITVAANALGTDTNKSATSGCVFYDTRSMEIPIPVWTVPRYTQTGTTANFGLRFVDSTGGSNRNAIIVTDLQPEDFEVTGVAPGAEVTISTIEWEITLSSAVANLSATDITITGNLVGSTIVVAGSGNTKYIIQLGRSASASDLPLANITINQTRHPGVRVTARIMRDDNYHLDIPLPTNQSGTVNLVLRKNAVEGPNEIRGPIDDNSSGTAAYDTRPDVPDADPLVGTWTYASWCETGNKIIAGIQFNKAISGLNVNSPSSDIQIANETKNANLTGWTFTFAGHTAGNPDSNTNKLLAADTTLRVEATPPPNTNANVYMLFVARSITFDTDQMGPGSNIYSEVIPVNNTGTGQIIPKLTNVVLGDRLEHGDNNILLSWDVPVKGVVPRAFRFDGLDLDFDDDDTNTITENIFDYIKIYYANSELAVTADIGTDPNTEWVPYYIPDETLEDPRRSPTTNESPTLKKQYFRMIINIPNRVTILQGLLNIYVRSGIINND